jgi:hypothetical protein
LSGASFSMPENASPPPQLVTAEEGNFFDAVTEWNGWNDYGPLIWTVALLLGYSLLLHQQPLRYAFGEGWALIREQGNGWVLGLTGILSLIVSAGEWWAGGSGNVEEMTAWGFRETDGGTAAGTAMIASETPSRQRIKAMCRSNRVRGGGVFSTEV